MTTKCLERFRCEGQPRLHKWLRVAVLKKARECYDVCLQVIGDPFLDFKMMVKPSPFLPGIDLASVPMFSTITNFALNKALGATLKYPLNISVPILDLEDPDVYYHMDLAGKVEGMFCVQVKLSSDGFGFLCIQPLPIKFVRWPVCRIIDNRELW